MFFHIRRSNARNVGAGVSYKQRDRLLFDELYWWYYALQLWCENNLRGRRVLWADAAIWQCLERLTCDQHKSSRYLHGQATQAALQGHGMTTAPKHACPRAISGAFL